MSGGKLKPGCGYGRNGQGCKRRMELMLRLIWQGGVLAAVMLFCGCVDIDYVGQRLPVREGADIMNTAVYDSPEFVPANTYTVLGRATLVAPEGVTMVDMREALLEKAISCGADALEIRRVRRREAGIMFRDVEMVSTPPAMQQASNVTMGGEPVYTDSFGKTTTLQTEKIERYETVVDALFLAKNERVAGYLKEVSAGNTKSGGEDSR